MPTPEAELDSVEVVALGDLSEDRYAVRVDLGDGRVEAVGAPGTARSGSGGCTSRYHACR
ncbi:MAG: hypothetical protein QGI49_05165 [SAR202 cluster bacterium]|nr:hypothetical protein [SAR202 cluster bacterium]